jgi:hypothetical protein
MLLFYILQKIAQQKLHIFQRSITKNNFRMLHYVALVSVPLQKSVHLQWYNYHEIKKYEAVEREIGDFPSTGPYEAERMLGEK